MPTAEISDEQRFQQEVRRNLRRNYSAHLCHGLLGQTGMRLLNAPTFLPAYVYSLAGSDLAVGIARGLQYLGMFLSPILAASLIEHRRRVLPVGLLSGALMRLSILGLALGGFLPEPLSLYLVWGFLACFGFFLGIQGVVFSTLIAKVIPVKRRGFLLGLRNALAGCTAFVVALYAGDALIAPNVLGNGYASTFLLAFVLTSLGLALLLFIREPRGPEVRVRSRLRDRLADLPDLLRSDPNFTRFFLGRATAVMGMMAVPYYVLYAAQRMDLGGAELGTLTGAFVLAQSLGNLGWGLLADRRGFRLVFLVALLLWLLAAAFLMQVESFPELVLTFAGLGAGLGGFQLSAQNLVLEFGSRTGLPLRVAVANSASEFVAACSSVGGGLLAMSAGYEWVFGLAIGFQLVALTVVGLGVREPRRAG
ncbi:MAG: MFS transporter [Myxococcales bacterium]|nr:MFS transporter [Myxococcales bacterium]